MNAESKPGQSGHRFIARPIVFRCAECALDIHTTINLQPHESLVNIVDECSTCGGPTRARYCECCGMASPYIDDKCLDCCAGEFLTRKELAQASLQNAKYDWWPAIEQRAKEQILARAREIIEAFERMGVAS